MTRRLFQIVLLCLLATGVARAADVIDRIVATVNGKPILQSDWDLAVRCEAFLDHRPLQGLTPEQQKATLDRLIDQELLRQQNQEIDLPEITPAQVQQQIKEIRSQYPDGGSEAGWQAALRHYGLTEDDLNDRVHMQLQILAFVERRLRPNVHIDSATIEAYYRDKLLPELRRQGAVPAPLVQVSPQIEELLSQQRVDTMLSAWLQDLRRQSEIHIAANIGSHSLEPHE